jgi:hypothetical protein
VRKDPEPIEAVVRSTAMPPVINLDDTPENTDWIKHVHRMRGGHCSDHHSSAKYRKERKAGG